MQTTMKYFSEAISDFSLEYHPGNEANGNVLGLTMMFDANDDPDMCCIFTDSTSLTSMIADHYTNLVISAKNTMDISEELYNIMKRKNYLIIDKKISLQEAAKLLQTIIRRKNFFYEQSERITHTISSDNGLQKVTEIISKIINAPVSVYDTAYVLLAHTEISNWENKFYNSTIEHGYYSEEIIDLIKKSGRFARIQASSEVVFTSTPEWMKTTPYGWLDVSVHINDLTVAYISAAGEKHPFESFDKDVLSYFSGIVSIELQKNKTFVQNHGVMYETFMYDLLDQRLKDMDSIQSRMRLLKIKLKKYYYIIAIHQRKDMTSRIIPTGTQAMFRGIFPGSISVPYKKGIVLLTSSDDWNPSITEENNELTDLLKSQHLYLGISNSFTDLTLAGYYYTQAYQAIEYGRRLFADQFWYYYKNIAMYHVIDLYSQNNDLLELCHPAVKNLFISQKDSDSETLETLESYIKHMKNASVVAEELHIHRSTIFYRLGKVKSMCHGYFDDGDEWKHLCFSIDIIDFLKALKNTD